MRRVILITVAILSSVSLIFFTQLAVTEPKDTEAATSGERRLIMQVARSYKGVPYVHGGGSRRGMDCTGFTKRVFARAVGVRLPHSVVGQWRRGRSIPAHRLRRGDIVFFAEGGGGLTHVGIYAGRGKLWHASNYFDKVVKSEMRYIGGYAGARRMT